MDYYGIDESISGYNLINKFFYTALYKYTVFGISGNILKIYRENVKHDIYTVSATTVRNILNTNIGNDKTTKNANEKFLKLLKEFEENLN